MSRQVSQLVRLCRRWRLWMSLLRRWPVYLWYLSSTYLSLPQIDDESIGSSRTSVVARCLWRQVFLGHRLQQRVSLLWTQQGVHQWYLRRSMLQRLRL